MSDTEGPGPDRVVETALRLLPVPDHGPDFWSRVEASLSAEPDRSRRAAAADPTVAAPPPTNEEPAREETGQVPAVVLEPVPLGVVPAAMRRPSNLVLSVLAVAAAVAVVVAGSALVRSRAADDTPDEDVAAPTATDAVDGSTSAPPVATLTAPEGEDEAVVVVDWVRALAEGDTEAAWELLGPSSQAHWGSLDAFAAERTAFAEGYGAWASATADQVIVTPLVEGSLAVVTLVGTVEQEGTSQVRADAFPVREVGGELRVELYGSAGAIEIVVPADPDADGRPSTLAVGDELIVVSPEEAEAPVLRVDDATPVTCGEAADTSLTLLDTTSGQRCAYQPGSLGAGDHVLTVAVWSGDGTSVTAYAVRFAVA